MSRPKKGNFAVSFNDTLFKFPAQGSSKSTGGVRVHSTIYSNMWLCTLVKIHPTIEYTLIAFYSAVHCTVH